MHLAPAETDAGTVGGNRLISDHIPAHDLNGRGLAALVGAIRALLGGHIVFVGQVAGKIGGGKGLQLLVVKRLNGVHVVIGHFC